MSATPGIAKTSTAESIGRVIKLSISLIYFAFDSGWSALRGLVGAKRSGTAIVLYYHNVPDAFRNQFAAQMRLVSRIARPVSVDDLNRLPEDTHSVAITFDDALDTVVTTAVPVLELLGIPATVFVVTETLGTTPEWGKTYYAPEERVMSEEQLRSLPKLIRVGSHTLTHPDLAAVSEETAAREIRGSREKLERLLQRPVTLFGFPYGSFNDAAVRLCREAGYERVFTTEPAMVPQNANEFAVGRVAADPWDWPLEFRLKMLGAYCWTRHVTSAKRTIRSFFSTTPKNSAGAESAKLAARPLR
jgi:peptidoglycan/xylan/chitin deacetylase (PgdA/CDA1 family)